MARRRRTPASSRLAGLVRLFAPLLVIASLPYLAWRLMPPRPRAVLILDKTVPVATYREHRGLMWILNHARVLQRDGHALPHPFRIDRDYFGFFPGAAHHYTIRDLPDDAASYDLIYLADTYGVTTEDFYGTLPEGERPRLIYGGLTARDVAFVEQHLGQGSTLMAEFNTLASPTRPGPRAAVSRLLGIRWSGWSGRYYTDLRAGGEVPSAIVDGYGAQVGRPWEFQGHGFVLVNEDGRIVVLRDAIDVGPGGLRVFFAPTEAARYGATDAEPYAYWFDIVTPAPGTRVVADYHLDLTPAGARRFQEAGLPSVFPAILRAEHPGYRSVYLAGDYADSDDVPSLWQHRGLDGVFRVLGRNPFFWNVYAPVMTRILEETGPGR